ncbi:MAG: hypothetical protein H7175_21405, partial [Burkholderiales bacterium]|nr:hypothetical protein [Anaerolineae bacterium]
MPLKDNFKLSIIRRDDMLVANFEFVNLELMRPTPGNPAHLRRVKSGDVLIIVTLPPQSIGEQTFYEVDENVDNTGSGNEAPVIPTRSRIAKPSRLVFRVSDSLLPVPYTLADLLRVCHQSDQVVRETMLPSVSPKALLDGNFTAIEAPYRLVISPNPESHWTHSYNPATNTESLRTELWHTRLRGTNRSIRAVWTWDFAQTIDPFTMSLSAADRIQLVRLSSDPLVPDDKRKPINAGRLYLSALGAWLRVNGAWDVPFTVPGITGTLFKIPDAQLTLAEWVHQAVMGRDYFVRVVNVGYLFPFGHLAALVAVTERKIQDRPDNEGKAAFLRTRMFVIVRQPSKTFERRHCPFREVTIQTLVTPDLANPNAAPSVLVPEKQAFWIQVPGQEDGVNEDFRFSLTATDFETGQSVDFTMPLVFVAPGVAAQTVIDKYNMDAANRRNVGFGGQKIAYAAPTQSGDTTYETATMLFTANAEDPNSQQQPNFFPVMESAEISVPSLKHLTGNASLPMMHYETKYLDAADGSFGSAADVFGRLSDFTAPVDPQKSGGLTATDFHIDGLSRTYGPVNLKPVQLDPANAAVTGDMLNGTFSPIELFKGVTLLGGLKLSDVINDVGLPPMQPNAVPQMITRQIGDIVETEFRWVVSNAPGQDHILAVGDDSGDAFEPLNGSTFSIVTTKRQPLTSGAGESTFTSVGTLT